MTATDIALAPHYQATPCWRCEIIRIIGVSSVVWHWVIGNLELILRRRAVR